MALVLAASSKARAAEKSAPRSAPTAFVDDGKVYDVVVPNTGSVRGTSGGWTLLRLRLQKPTGAPAGWYWVTEVETGEDSYTWVERGSYWLNLALALRISEAQPIQIVKASEVSEKARARVEQELERVRARRQEERAQKEAENTP